MNESNFQIPTNFVCRSCTADLRTISSKEWKKTTLAKQNFFSTKCHSCTQIVYFWQDMTTQKIHYTNKINVVLHEPEIPGNVGAIIRLACAFDLTLHLIEPFGFIYSEKWLGRASAGHFQLNKQKLYSSWAEFIAKNSNGSLIMTSSQASKEVHNFNFQLINAPIYLVFGRESTGLPSEITSLPGNNNLKIAQTTLTSSINLAQAVAIVAFALRSQYDNFAFSKS